MVSLCQHCCKKINSKVDWNHHKYVTSNLNWVFTQHCPNYLKSSFSWGRRAAFSPNRNPFLLVLRGEKSSILSKANPSTQMVWSPSTSPFQTADTSYYQLFSYIFRKSFPRPTLSSSDCPTSSLPFSRQRTPTSSSSSSLPLPPGFYSTTPLSNASLPSLHHLLLQRRHFTFLISCQ